MSFKELRINGTIRIPEVRVVDENGGSLGVMKRDDALKMAEERGFDLVEISPNAKPPVCKIMDYGKFKFEQTKKDKQNKKKQHVIVVKEIQIRPNIGEHDLEIKLAHAEEFLGKGFKIKFVIRFRGRELEYKKIKGDAMFDRVVKRLAECGDVENQPANEERSIIFVMAPRKVKP